MPHKYMHYAVQELPGARFPSSCQFPWEPSGGSARERRRRAFQNMPESPLCKRLIPRALEDSPRACSKQMIVGTLRRVKTLQNHHGTPKLLKVEPDPATPGREIRRLRMDRSEERRVGKECRCRWSPYH